MLKPVLVANKLRFTDVSLASIAPHLSALTLEPSCLATVAKGQAEDPILQCYITHAALLMVSSVYVWSMVCPYYIAPHM